MKQSHKEAILLIPQQVPVFNVDKVNAWKPTGPICRGTGRHKSDHLIGVFLYTDALPSGNFTRHLSISELINQA